MQTFQAESPCLISLGGGCRERDFMVQHAVSTDQGAGFRGAQRKQKRTMDQTNQRTLDHSRSRAS